MREKLLTYIGFKAEVSLDKLLKQRADEVGLKPSDVARYCLRRGLAGPIEIFPHKVSCETKC
jgi:hypothetical protein